MLDSIFVLVCAYARTYYFQYYRLNNLSKRWHLLIFVKLRLNNYCLNHDNKLLKKNVVLSFLSLELGIWVKPRKGRALVWNNMNEEGKCEALSVHNAAKVNKGHKYILQRW